MKQRLDKILVERGYAASRERAQALILAGRVLVAEQKSDKPGASFAEDVAIRMLGDDLRYVSRGGLKLEGALKTFAIDVTGRACADIGASTGGFTDCMLQHGATSVLAVDTGYGQIAHTLRVDSRVTLLERTNARKLTPGELFDLHAKTGGQGGCPIDDGPIVMSGPPQNPVATTPNRITFFAIDVSFISSTLILPALIAALAPAGTAWQGEAVLLIKPQFEAGREHVGKGGIVRDPAAHQLAIDRVQNAVTALGGECLALIPSPILGMEGNREFLLHTRFD